MRRALLGALLFVGLACGQGTGRPEGAPACASACGEELYGSSDCSSFQRTEDACLSAYSRSVLGWGEERECQSVRGFALQVLVLDAGFWWDSQAGYDVDGEDYYWGDWAQVSYRPDAGLREWYQGAFCHELGHQLQDGLGYLQPDGTFTPHLVDFYHRSWEDAGIYAGILAVRAADAGE